MKKTVRKFKVVVGTLGLIVTPMISESGFCHETDPQNKIVPDSTCEYISMNDVLSEIKASGRFKISDIEAMVNCGGTTGGGSNRKS